MRHLDGARRCGICDAELLWEEEAKEKWEYEYLCIEAEISEMLGQRVEWAVLSLVSSAVAGCETNDVEELANDGWNVVGSLAKFSDSDSGSEWELVES